jgi:hypothetical protein
LTKVIDQKYNEAFERDDQSEEFGELATPKADIEYRSRGDLLYIDTESRDRESVSSVASSKKGNYNRINYLKAQEGTLE